MTSYHGCGRKLCTFTKKELETVKVAQKLLGAPTIGGVSAWAGGGGRGSKRRQINFPTTTHQKCWEA